jgi:hypothetical protein
MLSACEEEVSGGELSCASDKADSTQAIRACVTSESVKGEWTPVTATDQCEAAPRQSPGGLAVCQSFRAGVFREGGDPAESRCWGFAANLSAAASFRMGRGTIAS